ncbi:MAG: EAL domain-containing protein [Deltaproteobacteria bacterium]|nr:EAL domain-containing protein [Deltaproteobacteria bacterium]
MHDPNELPPPPGALDETLRDGRFGMVFQPIVDLRKRTIFAYEALVRPHLHPSPPSLIADAAAQGRLGLLGRTLRQAAIDGCPEAPLFINIRPDELLEHYLVQTDDPIFNHGRDVFLELTESVPLARLDLCSQMLQEIQSRGVHLVVDDLGSGYSNLRYLADLKPRVVKLDRELVTGLRPGTRRFTLVRGLVNLCNDLDALVVAECIETQEELSAAIEAGCHLGQGYVLARPELPPPESKWPL